MEESLKCFGGGCDRVVWKKVLQSVLEEVELELLETWDVLLQWEVYYSTLEQCVVVCLGVGAGKISTLS